MNKPTTKAKAKAITISITENEVIFSIKLDLRISLKLIVVSLIIASKNFYFNRKYGIKHILK